jgi:FtsP/CotA-like multicopper oxidase with cupredoxin domain
MTRRRALAALAPILGAGVAARYAVAEDGAAAAPQAHDHTAGSDHLGFQHGATVDSQRNGFNPTRLLRDFDTGRISKLPSGQTLREFELIATEKQFEVAPGVHFSGWAYNNRIPGPTLRAQEGDRVRVTLRNVSAHPHTIHFHGLHAARVDGVPGVGDGNVAPGRSTVYEFDAEPFGLHLFHCHSIPLAPHISKGLYGTFIIDPKDARPAADELVMVMNGFDTNFDRANEIYAANSIPFAYMHEPIQVRRGELVRIYLVNVLEFDLINSFHVHGNFFDWYPTGTSKTASEFTDTVMLCQGQRGIIEICFQESGKFMFHAHQSEFTELGWMGFFEVSDKPARADLLCTIKPGTKH